MTPGRWLPTPCLRSTLFRILTLTVISSLLLTPAFVSGALFPKNSLVKTIDAKEFRQVMKLNQTSLVAFVAPWCGHCQRLAPEFSSAAIGLNPLIGTYAVDCDDDINKRLCSQQDVKGFPTIKLFPRGKYLPPMLYDQERTTGALYNYAARRVPKAFTSLNKIGDVKAWVEKNESISTLALLITKDAKVPLLWKVLANKYLDTPLQFGAHTDKDGKAALELFGHERESQSKTKSEVLVWIGGKGPMRYTGVTKLEPLTNFLDGVLDGKDLETLPLESEQRGGDAKGVPSRDEL